MKDLRYTLLSDGASDQALLPLLTWLLRVHGTKRLIQSQWADLRRLRTRPPNLSARIQRSVELYPCDLLFVHRDAEAQSRQRRVDEIHLARSETDHLASTLPTICVVPVRMQEAWLLFDETAIRWASGNPHGQQLLALPPLRQVEQLPNPKSLLYELLREASGLHGRRRKNLLVSESARRVAEFINDFTPLETLPAFHALKSDIQSMIQMYGWASNDM